MLYFASLKQEGHSCTTKSYDIKLGLKAEPNIQNFQQVMPLRSWIFCLYKGSAFLFSTYSVFERPIEIGKQNVPIVPLGTEETTAKRENPLGGELGRQRGCCSVRLGATLVRVERIDASRLTQILVCE